jgi:hypothetical protein
MINTCLYFSFIFYLLYLFITFISFIYILYKKKFLKYAVAVEKGVVERRLGPTFNFQLTGPELLRMQCLIPEWEPKC